LIIKAILRILIILLTLASICHCKKEAEQGVAIPDNDFLKALIEQGVDKDGDGNISPSEAELITILRS